MSVLIGIAGQKGSGKNTVAEMIRDWCSEQGLSHINRGFADNVKLAVMRLFKPDATVEEALAWADRWKNDDGISATFPWEDSGYVTSRQIATVRELLQRMGTEVGREIFGVGCWTNALLPEDPMADEPFYAYHDIGTISDVRFGNEAKRIKNTYGGELWLVQRPDLPPPEDHASEKPLPIEIFDRIIINEGSLEDLHEKVSGAMRDLVDIG